MKVVVLAFLLSNCVSIPSYTTRYVCDKSLDVREKLAHATDTCIRSSAVSGAKELKRYITQCRANAMSIYCKRKAYFKRWTFPYGESVELPCSEAQSAAEFYVCQLAKD